MIHHVVSGETLIFVFEDEPDTQLLTHEFICSSNHLSIKYVIMLEEMIFNFFRRDVLSTSDDEIFRSP